MINGALTGIRWCVQYFFRLHRTCCIGQREEQMIGDLATFQVTGESREMMAASDIDSLHVIVDIIAMLQLAVYGTTQRVDRRWWRRNKDCRPARIMRRELTMEDESWLTPFCICSYFFWQRHCSWSLCIVYADSSDKAQLGYLWDIL
jgi:hypothetical protein